MTENKSSALTDEEIITVLKCCSTDHCKLRKCPLFDVNPNDCVERLSKNALALINRQKAEIEAFKHYYNECLKDLKNANAEVEGLQSRNKFLEIEFKNNANLFDNRMAGAKAEAIKEFAERLKNGADGLPYSWIAITQTALYGIVDDLLKEMVGEG